MCALEKGGGLVTSLHPGVGTLAAFRLPSSTGSLGSRGDNGATSPLAIQEALVLVLRSLHGYELLLACSSCSSLVERDDLGEFLFPGDARRGALFGDSNCRTFGLIAFPSLLVLARDLCSVLSPDGIEGLGVWLRIAG